MTKRLRPADRTPERKLIARTFFATQPDALYTTIDRLAKTTRIWDAREWHPFGESFFVQQLEKLKKIPKRNERQAHIVAYMLDKSRNWTIGSDELQFLIQFWAHDLTNKYLGLLGKRQIKFAYRVAQLLFGDLPTVDLEGARAFEDNGDAIWCIDRARSWFRYCEREWTAARNHHAYLRMIYFSFLLSWTAGGIHGASSIGYNGRPQFESLMRRS